MLLNIILSRLLTISFPFHLYPYLAAIVQEETKLEVVAENVSPESSVVKSPGNRITPGPPQTWNYFDNWVSEFLHFFDIDENIFIPYTPSLTVSFYRMKFLRNLSCEQEMVREIKSLFFLLYVFREHETEICLFLITKILIMSTSL